MDMLNISKDLWLLDIWGHNYTNVYSGLQDDNHCHVVCHHMWAVLTFDNSNGWSRHRPDNVSTANGHVLVLPLMWVEFEATFQSSGVYTHRTQRLCDNFWLRLTWSTTLMILGWNNSSALFWGRVWDGLWWHIVMMTEYCKLVCITWIYNALWALRFAYYGFMWSCCFVDLEWARNNPRMAKTGIESGIFIMNIVSYAFPVAML